LAQLGQIGLHMKVFLGLAIASAATVAAAATTCERSGDRVGACFWVHGRLRAYNGAPTFRIWPTGTHRLLGVNAPRGEDSSNPRFPAEVNAARGTGFDAFGTALFGDYLVCPLSRPRAGRMQFVCVARARRVIAAHP